MICYFCYIELCLATATVLGCLVPLLRVAGGGSIVVWLSRNFFLGEFLFQLSGEFLVCGVKKDKFVDSCVPYKSFTWELKKVKLL